MHAVPIFTVGSRVMAVVPPTAFIAIVASDHADDHNAEANPS